jgi:hypothetical protein
MPLGSIELTVKRGDQGAPLPIAKVNRIEEGDEIQYAPSLKPKEKRSGEIAIVLVASNQDNDFAILDAKDAEKPAKWTVPFRTSLAMYVYGPSGLSIRKLRGVLKKDNELIAQLAEYAEKTSQTESVLQAIAQYESTSAGDNLQAALQGFAQQSGINGKLDRTASSDQQMLSALRTLNPALSAYDPISPSGTARLGQTAGLAATVAGMFLGSTVGLAAGGTAMALNLKTLLFPDTDFRSAYSQPTQITPESVSLCTAREPFKTRKRIGYLWALRIPDAKQPPLKIEGPNNIPAGLRSSLKIDVNDSQRKLLSRVQRWSLKPVSGDVIPASVNAVPDQRALEINLATASVPPGRYELGGMWDWDPLKIDGEVLVSPLATLENARLTPESQNRLRQGSGKQLVTLEGADFQFVEKALVAPKNDKYVSPTPAQFTLPKGARQGSQMSMELQIDTTNLRVGDYALMLFQADGKPHEVNFKVVADPPKLNGLPLTVNEDESEGRIVIQGEGLDRITGLSAPGYEFELEPSVDAKQRNVKFRHTSEATDRLTGDLRVSVRDYAQPIVLANAFSVAGPKPRIAEATPSLPADLQIGLRERELPAGIFMGVMMRVTGAGTEPAISLACKESKSATVRVPAGAEKDGVKLQVIQTNSLFVSLDPGAWPAGCALTAVLHHRQNGSSDPFQLGRVLRLPSIESFKLTDEAAGEGEYFGILTGRDLELIGQVGWNAESGKPVVGLPVPIVGEGAKQSLKVRLSWPSPTPHSPLFVWFRGEDAGRATKLRY